VLFTDKCDVVVRYALPEGSTPIFALRFKLQCRQIEFVEPLRRDALDDGE
jgi:hypothetical protein